MGVYINNSGNFSLLEENADSIHLNYNIIRIENYKDLIDINQLKKGKITLLDPIKIVDLNDIEQNVSKKDIIKWGLSFLNERSELKSAYVSSNDSIDITSPSLKSIDRKYYLHIHIKDRDVSSRYRGLIFDFSKKESEKLYQATFSLPISVFENMIEEFKKISILTLTSDIKKEENEQMEFIFQEDAFAIYYFSNEYSTKRIYYSSDIFDYRAYSPFKITFSINELYSNMKQILSDRPKFVKLHFEKKDLTISYKKSSDKSINKTITPDINEKYNHYYFNMINAISEDIEIKKNEVKLITCSVDPMAIDKYFVDLDSIYAKSLTGSKDDSKIEAINYFNEEEILYLKPLFPDLFKNSLKLNLLKEASDNIILNGFVSYPKFETLSNLYKYSNKTRQRYISGEITFYSNHLIRLIYRDYNKRISAINIISSEIDHFKIEYYEGLYNELVIQESSKKPTEIKEQRNLGNNQEQIDFRKKSENTINSIKKKQTWKVDVKSSDYTVADLRLHTIIKKAEIFGMLDLKTEAENLRNNFKKAEISLTSNEKESEEMEIKKSAFKESAEMEIKVWKFRSPKNFGGTMHDFIAHAEQTLGNIITKAEEYGMKEISKNAKEVLEEVH